MQAITENPEACAYGRCPWEAIADDPLLLEIYFFAASCLNKSPEYKDSKTGERKGGEWGVSIAEAFLPMCEVRQVPPDDREELLRWVAIVADARNESGDWWAQRVAESVDGDF